MSIKKIVTTSTLLLLYSYTLASAQSPTVTEPGTTLREAVKEAVKEQVDSIKQAVAKRSFVGTISKISDLNLTLTTLTGDSRSITMVTDTTVKLISGKEGTLKDIKEGSFVIAMGNIDSAGVLTSKRIVIIAKGLADTRVALYGKATKTAASQLTIETPDKTTLTLKILSDTKFSTKSKVTAAKDIKEGFTIVAIAKPGTTKTTFNLTRLFVIPSAPAPTPSLTSTPTP